MLKRETKPWVVRLSNQAYQKNKSQHYLLLLLLLL